MDESSGSPGQGELQEIYETLPDFPSSFGREWGSGAAWDGFNDDEAIPTITNGTGNTSRKRRRGLIVLSYAAAATSGFMAASLLLIFAWGPRNATQPISDQPRFTKDLYAGSGVEVDRRRELEDIWSNPEGLSDESRINKLISLQPTITLSTHELISALENVQGSRTAEEKRREVLNKIEQLLAPRKAPGL